MLILYAALHLSFFVIGCYKFINSLILKSKLNSNKIEKMNCPNTEVENLRNDRDINGLSNVPSLTEFEKNSPWYIKLRLSERFNVIKISIYLVFVQEWSLIIINGIFHQNYSNPRNNKDVATFNLINWFILTCLTYDTISLIYYCFVVKYGKNKNLKPAISKKAGSLKEKNLSKDIKSQNCSLHVESMSELENRNEYQTQQSMYYKNGKYINITENESKINTAYLNYIDCEISENTKEKNKFLKTNNVLYLLKNILMIAILVGLQNMGVFPIFLMMLFQLLYCGLIVYGIFIKGMFKSLLLRIYFLATNLLLFVYFTYAMLVKWQSFKTVDKGFENYTLGS